MRSRESGDREGMRKNPARRPPAADEKMREFESAREPQEFGAVPLSIIYTQPV